MGVPVTLVWFRPALTVDQHSRRKYLRTGVNQNS